MGSREGAIARAVDFFDGGGFERLLTDLVAVPSTSQEEGSGPALSAYLDSAMQPWLDRLGFVVTISPNPLAGFGPILTATRVEDPARPTILLYG
ncbi:hypothetical protein [Falsiroseomonas sp. E2-1-a20]|uniref:hypothetical protein n=1 Tax=Falsiroseomonas sp. E2-1-a20 TaxID=3239300 RepID=UPI003F32C91A